MKVAQETLDSLQAVTTDNRVLNAKLAQTEQQLKKQAAQLEAYAHVFNLVKTGEIDVSQVEDELSRVLKLGLAVYKEASLAPDSSDRFGEILPVDRVETQKTASMLDGRSVDAMTAWMLEWREIRKGIPSGLAPGA